MAASTSTRGLERIAWAGQQMPVLARIGERFATDRPLAGVNVAACLHVTAETANLVLALSAGGAQVALCSANPLATQDQVVAALCESPGITVLARHGESYADYEAHIAEVITLAAGGRRWVTVDDGADLMIAAHQRCGSDGPTGAGGPTGPNGVIAPEGSTGPDGLIGGTEETTTGLVRLRRLEGDGALSAPVFAVNEARTERALNDRHGTGQSALDGIVRATNVLLAGRTVVVIGFGWAGQGIAERARGAGAAVIVCEVEPLRALEARMAGYEVMPSLEAAARGDIFITVTGSRRVLHGEHFQAMKDGALLANAGHFDVEIALEDLRDAAVNGVHTVRPLVEQYVLTDGRRLNLLAAGRVVNLLAGEGHPAAVMDVSFALQALSIEALVTGPTPPPGVHPVPEQIDREVARLKLAALDVAIDHSTPEQDGYRQSWR